MKKKKRTPIPIDISANVLFQSDRTCCVCNIRGKSVQIHHIDENPSNNEISNLSVLCLECHNDTMIKGGFGRKLDATQIKIYRDEWNKRVKNRKIKADEIASIKSVTNIINTNSEFENELNYKNRNPELLMDYLEKLINIQKEQLDLANNMLGSGVTDKMIVGNYYMIDFYEEVLVELATFYPKGHFNNLHPKDYFNEIVSSKFIHHKLILEPNGIGTGDYLVDVITGSIVWSELKKMVFDIVNALWPIDDKEKKRKLIEWKDKWEFRKHYR